MKGTNLTTGQIITIGVTIVFGLPLCVGLVVGHFLGFWFGVASGGLVLLFIAYLAQRWMKR
jgi:Na+/H+ antiporter NhaC